MTNRFPRRALACALLASTALISPAHAQTATANPERFMQMDENGVDLLTDMYVGPLTEGKIGSGEGAVSVIRGSWGPDQWSGLIYRTGGTTMVVQFGPISDTFTQSGSSWVPTKANGASLTPTGNLGEWLYTARDGSTVVYETYDNVFSSGGLSEGQPNPITGPGCSGADPGTCGVPMSITRPDGMVFHLNWDFVDECSPKNIFPCQNGSAYFRFRGVTSSAGYGFTRNYVTDDPGAFSAPQSNWFVRTNVTFSDGTTATYSGPTNGVSTLTDTLGRVWTFTTAADGSTHIRRPGSATDNIIIGNGTGGTVPFVTKDGVTTNYSRTVSGTTSTMVKTDPFGHTKTIVGDLNLGRVTSITDELGHTTSYAYDANGRLTRVTKPEGNYTQYAYDARGNLTTTTQVAKPGSGIANSVSSASFDATCGNIVTCNSPHSTTDAKGNVTTYTYDSTTGAVLTVTRPAPTAGAVQPQTRYSYAQVTGAGGDAVAELTGISECQTTASCTGTADETKVTATYNAQLLPATVTRANGTGTLAATTSVTYDARGNLNTVDGPLPGTADTTKYRYDAGDQLLGVTSPDPDGTGSMVPRAIRLTYRGDGQVSKEELGTVTDQSDAAWASFSSLQTVDVAFDGNSRPVQQKLSAGGTAYALKQTDYDALGRVNCTAVRMNRAVYGSLPGSACTLSTQGSFGPDQISQNVYDPAGQVTQQLTGVGTADAAAERTMTYTANGKMALLMDGENNLTSYVYDGFDRLQTTGFPLTAKGADGTDWNDTEQFGYDANGNVTSRRTRAGQTIGYSYDALNRLTFKDLPGSEPDLTFAYDNLGRMTSASRLFLSYAFSYDALSRETSEAGPNAWVNQQFDLAGRRTQLSMVPGTGTLPGFALNYQRLTTGEIASISDGNNVPLVNYAYDNLGNRTALQFSQGAGGTTWSDYDPISRLGGKTNDLAGTANDVTKTFSYDPASRIATETRNNDNYAWNGSVNVNRLYASNGLNQYTSAGPANFTYDANGNLTSDGTSSFAYDSQNQLVSATVNGVTTSFSYDALGRLYALSNGSEIRRFVPSTDDSGTPEAVAEFDANDQLSEEYGYGPGPDEPMLWWDGAAGFAQRNLEADERGSIVAVTDTSGNPVSINRYDEYGIPASTNGGPFGYTGQLWLPEVGLYYYKNRFYSPTLGRFLQTDPIGQADNANLYAYVHNDPVNGTDPSGEFASASAVGDGSDGQQIIGEPPPPMLNELNAPVDNVSGRIDELKMDGLLQPPPPTTNYIRDPLLNAIFGAKAPLPDFFSPGDGTFFTNPFPTSPFPQVLGDGWYDIDYSYPAPTPFALLPGAETLIVTTFSYGFVQDNSGESLIPITAGQIDVAFYACMTCSSMSSNFAGVFTGETTFTSILVPPGAGYVGVSPAVNTPYGTSFQLHTIMHH